MLRDYQSIDWAVIYKVCMLLLQKDILSNDFERREMMGCVHTTGLSKFSY